MKIVVDLDRTVLECDTFIYSLGNKINVNKGIDVPLSYKEVDPIKANKGIDLLFFMKLGDHRIYKPIENSVEILQKWNKQGFSLTFVSTRPNIKSQSRSAVNWLDSNGIKYDKIILACKNKAKFCTELGYDLLIDDTLKHCNDTVKLGGKAIWLQSERNKNQISDKLPKVKHATCWTQIDGLVQMMKRLEESKNLTK